MDNVILHISDLHVTTYKGSDGSINPKIDSLLTNNIDETANKLFLEIFVNKIKNDFGNKKITLLITGDISNWGEKTEFIFADKFIRDLMTGLGIGEKDCLIIPGDHDVHRRSIENALEENPTDEPHLLNDVKFRNFSEFYNKLKTIPFAANKIIIDYVIIDEKVVLVAINSNFKINNKGGLGYIPIEQFKEELSALKESLARLDLQYIACWHHNFMASFEDSNSGQWEVENRLHLIAALESLEIKLVLTGNEHTSGSGSLHTAIMTSDCGTLSSKYSDAAFKVYPVVVGEEILLQNKIYGLQKTGSNNEPYYWQLRDNDGARQPAEFKLLVPNKEVIEESLDLPSSPDKQESVQRVPDSPEDERIFYDNVEKSNQLYAIIRDKKLFHSGHFHWSDSSRAHNWIDVSKLLEDHNDLAFVQSAVIDVINQFDLASDSSLIIGLGYEGNIISSKPSIKFNIPYTSLPYSYRYKDHHEYEKKLNFDNTDGAHKSVIIITDVVNDGRTIRKLIDKREKEFFKKVEKVIVVSLFYTGHQKINIDILNYDQLPENYDREQDHKVNKITFYTVKSLRVEKCPFGKDYRTECLIFKDELSCVHLFYDDVTT